MTSTIKKRRSLSVEEKVRMIELLEAGASNADVCRYLGISQSTLSTIWKSREHLKTVFYSDFAHKKKLKSSQHKDIEQALLQWFKVQRSQNFPISGPILQEKADDFARLLNKPNFKCSASWITRFRKRHNIVFKKMSEDTARGSMDVFENWLEAVWPALRRDFADCDVYNADETGLFYNLTPDKTMYYRGETCRAGEMSKDRLTVLVAANMSGTDKRNLLVVGKAKTPRSLYNSEQSSILYRSNKRSWMSSEIFTHWLNEWDHELMGENRRILLTVDNCPSHSPVVNLKNIKLVFLPPNTSGVLQPMEQGIIRSLKVNYRRRMILKIVNREEQDKELNISIPDAIRMLQDSWTDVTKLTIKNCFRGAGFKMVHESDESNDGSDGIVDEWGTNLNEPLSVEELVAFAEVDEELMTSDMRTDKQIAESVLSAEEAKEEEPEGEDGEETYKVPSLSEAFYALDTLRAYVDGHPEMCRQIPETASVLSRIGKIMENSYFVKTEEARTTNCDYSN